MPEMHWIHVSVSGYGDLRTWYTRKGPWEPEISVPSNQRVNKRKVSELVFTFYASALAIRLEALCFRVVRPCVRACVRPSFRPSHKMLKFFQVFIT